MPASAGPWRPRAAGGFRPERIILARGSLASAQRRKLVEAICAIHAAAEVIDRRDVPHNRIEVGALRGAALIDRGKRTLVFGEHRSAVRLSRERHNACPNYWHFSPYGFCPYGCAYCYLAGTRGVSFSPTVKVFVNLPEILGQVDRVARRLGRPTAFYLGKLQDGLALDPLTGYSRILVPFFAAHPYARMIVLTKSADVAGLAGLGHGGHTTLTWSLSPPEVAEAFEPGTPPVSARLDAMRTCAAAGYALRAVLMPIIPVPDWRELHARFLRSLLAAVPLERITLGGICSFPTARRLMEHRLGGDNAMSAALSRAPGRSADGRARYAPAERIAIYRHLLGVVRDCRADLDVGLCLEEREVFQALGLAGGIGRCNCVL